MRIFQEEIFGPVVSVTTFKDEADALRIANDTLYGLGAGVWTRDANVGYRMVRGIQAGRVCAGGDSRAVEFISTRNAATVNTSMKVR